jgi:hypothetical protein
MIERLELLRLWRQRQQRPIETLAGPTQWRGLLCLSAARWTLIG